MDGIPTKVVRGQCEFTDRIVTRDEVYSCVERKTVVSEMGSAVPLVTPTRQPITPGLVGLNATDT